MRREIVCEQEQNNVPKLCLRQRPNYLARLVSDQKTSDNATYSDLYARGRRLSVVRSNENGRPEVSKADDEG